MAFDEQTGVQVALGAALLFSLVGLANDTNSALFAEAWFIPIIVALLWTSFKA
jgi:hypothetical protein